MKNLFFALTCSAFLFTATSCDDHDDVINPDKNVPANVLSAFQKKYSNVNDVRWEQVKGYYVARFNAPIITRGSDFTSSAWYTSDGVCHQEDQEMEFMALPAAVKDGFNLYFNKMYQGWKIDDAEKVLRKDMDLIYVVEIEKGEQEREISVSEKGDILKDVIDQDDKDDVLPVVIPNEVQAALKKIFPNSYSSLVLLEADFDDDDIELDVMDGKYHKEVKLDKRYNWIETEYEVSMAEAMTIIDPAVLAKLKEAAQKNGIDITSPEIQKLIEVEVHEHATKGLFFEVEIELGGQDLEITIDKDGNFVIND